jgi:hypothetical protein
LTAPHVPRPPSPFPAINAFVLKAGTALHRTHGRSYRPDQFNPCKGDDTRFSPIGDAFSVCIPTLYAATSRQAAAFESIFHDIEPSAPFKTVRLEIIERRTVSEIAPTRDLTLASLFAPDLKAWGLQRTDLIETPKSTYTQTARWAEAIHASRVDIDGLIWTSRQCDPETCVVLFGDRVDEADLRVLASQNVAGAPLLLRQIRDFGARAGIAIVT